MDDNTINKDTNNKALNICCPYFKDGRCHFSLNGGFDFGFGTCCTAPFCGLFS